jgi:enoyl-CoA hydratase/carnithine racemase
MAALSQRSGTRNGLMSAITSGLSPASPAAIACLEVTTQGGITQLQLQRPERRNALSAAMLEELGYALSKLADDRETRVVVLSAAGPVFSSGHDLKEMLSRSADEYQQLFSRCARVMQQLRALPQPVIARVQGLATAAGCQLVAACDLAVAADTAQFATPGVKIGLFCMTPMVPLVRSVPSKVALEMLLTGQPISAQRAYDVGLINRVVPADQLDQAIAELTEPLLAASPEVLRQGKQAFYAQRMLDESAAYTAAVDSMTSGACQPDAQEGISAFLQKRTPQWTGG